MTTSIRAIRKQRGLTLQQLADAVGTTPQTIQRLETGNMSVSVDWLERIAGALGLAPADLLGPATVPVVQRVPVIGQLVKGGTVDVAHRALAAAEVASGFADDNGADFSGDAHVTIPSPTEQCVAIRISVPTGHYAEGTVLIGRRREQITAVQTSGDCVIGLQSGEIALWHVAVARNGKMTFTAYDAGADGITHDRIAWIAPVYIVVRDV
jgi:transcriptional regulator with XRE-family HTH domain